MTNTYSLFTKTNLPKETPVDLEAKLLLTKRTERRATQLATDYEEELKREFGITIFK